MDDKITSGKQKKDKKQYLKDYYEKHKKELNRKKREARAMKKAAKKKVSVKKGRPSLVDKKLEQKRASNNERKARERKRKKEEGEARRQREEDKKQKNRERVARFRTKEKSKVICPSPVKAHTRKQSHPQSPRSRMNKKRAVDKVRHVLPDSTPEKVKVIKGVLSSEPNVSASLQADGFINSKEQQRTNTLLSAVASDLSESFESVKSAHSNDNRAAHHVAASVTFGKKVRSVRGISGVSKMLGVHRRFAARKSKDRDFILSSKGKKCWLVTTRKVRKDAVDEETQNLIYKWWKENSRPAGSTKNDIVRRRLGKKHYVEHARQVLEKSQLEIYQDFICENKDLQGKICLRKFESLKPFFVKKAKIADRQTCMCRLHVETRMLLEACMKFRKKAENDLPIWEHLSQAACATLCDIQEGETHKRACLERSCDKCGTDRVEFSSQELDKTNTTLIKWQRYEYVVVGVTNEGKDKKKISLVDKETPPGEMFEYFIELLEKYPLHQFNAKWQREQCNKLINQLPQSHCLAVHDFSENYTLKHDQEIQSEYFSSTQAALHVTVLYRHAVPEVDQEESSEENPIIIKEYIICISDDVTHDHHFVHKARSHIAEYLKNIGANITVMHEFTDGCAAQYKSRHCMGDISNSEADYGFKTIRNFFETSHAKGEQDAAGGHCKTRADYAIVREGQQFKTAADLYLYLSDNFQEPTTDKSDLKRRLFFQITDVNRKRSGVKEIPGGGIRSWHSVQSTGQPGRIEIRKRTCYCNFCMYEEFHKCEDQEYVDKFEVKSLDFVSNIKASTRNQQVEAEDNMAVEEMEKASDLVQEGSNIIIAADDDIRNDFYVMNVTSSGVETLENDETDDYGITFKQGSEVFKGNFFELTNATDMEYTKNCKKAMVHALTMRCLAPELRMKVKRNGKTSFKLSMVQHQDIMSALY